MSNTTRDADCITLVVSVWYLQNVTQKTWTRYVTQQTWTRYVTEDKCFSAVKKNALSYFGFEIREKDVIVQKGFSNRKFQM